MPLVQASTPEAERAQAQQAEIVEKATVFVAIHQLRAKYIAEVNRLRAQASGAGAPPAPASDPPPVAAPYCEAPAAAPGMEAFAAPAVPATAALPAEPAARPQAEPATEANGAAATAAMLVPPGSAKEEDSRLGAEIAAAVANFLSGDMGEVGSDDEDEENFNPIVDSGLADQHPAGQFVGNADIAEHPCLLRGSNFSASLSEVQLPREVQAVGSKEALEKLHQQIESSVADLYRKRKLPTAVEVQKQLRERGVEEPAVQLLVLVCAQARHLFALWVTSDGVVSVLLPREPIQDFILQAEFSEEQYSQEFVEAFVNMMNQRAGQADAAVETSPKMKVHQPEPEPQPVLVVDRARTGAVGAGVAGRYQVSARPEAPSRPQLEMLARSLQQQNATTLMIRNLPLSVTQKRVVDELRDSGFEGRYDFCHVPLTFGTGVGKGFAFVNFTSDQALFDFVISWHGSRRFGLEPCEPSLNVAAAALQGREENAKRWAAPRFRRTRNPALRPLVVAEASPAVAGTLEADAELQGLPAPPPGLEFMAPAAPIDTAPVLASTSMQ